MWVATLPWSSWGSRQSGLRGSGGAGARVSVRETPRPWEALMCFTLRHTEQGRCGATSAWGGRPWCGPPAGPGTSQPPPWAHPVPDSRMPLGDLAAAPASPAWEHPVHGAGISLGDPSVACPLSSAQCLEWDGLCGDTRGGGRRRRPPAGATLRRAFTPLLLPTGLVLRLCSLTRAAASGPLGGCPTPGTSEHRWTPSCGQAGDVPWAPVPMGLGAQQSGVLVATPRLPGDQRVGAG